MNRKLTLIEVLQPRSFRDTPERLKATRTIMQPEVDAFEQREAEMLKGQKSASAGRRPAAELQSAA